MQSETGAKTLSNKTFSRTNLVTIVIAASLFGGLFLVAGASPAKAREGWTAIGSRTVADDLETDVIRARGKARFSQIRLCVAHKAVRLADLDVRFASGGAQDIAVRRRIGAGTCTRAIDLAGGRRDLQSVRMRYETVRERGRQAVVTVYAR